MLIYITGVAGAGKSTLRQELERKGYPAEDADEGFCAWFDGDGNRVPTLALHLRTPEWYASHRWNLLAERVSNFANACGNDLGFLLGVAANADELASYFGATFYLTANSDLIHDRLRNRDGSAHATRFAAFASVKDWQRSAEQRWVRQGYASLDSSDSPTDVADTLLRLIARRG